jgi:hypothetical protein
MDVYFRLCPRVVRVTTLIFRHSLRMSLEFLDDPRPFLYLKIATVSGRKKIIGLAQRNPLPNILLDPEETRALNATYHQRIHRDQSNLIPLGSGGLHPTSSRTSGQRPLPRKRHGPHGPDRAQASRDLLQRHLQPPSKKTPLSHCHVGRSTFENSAFANTLRSGRFVQS